MSKQIFEIWRAPEAKPIEAHEIRYWLWMKRQDTEWDVREVKEDKDENSRDA